LRTTASRRGSGAQLEGVKHELELVECKTDWSLSSDGGDDRREGDLGHIRRVRAVRRRAVTFGEKGG
jgi:hypothetical protein